MYTICFLLIFEFVVADLDCPGGQASACDPEPAQPEGGMSWLLTVVPVSQPASQLASQPVSQPASQFASPASLPAQPEKGKSWLLAVVMGHWDGGRGRRAFIIGWNTK